MNTFPAKRRTAAMNVIFLSLLVGFQAGCGSGGDSAGIGGTGEPVRVSVVGGTGFGTITGFGSIIINDKRRFEVTQETRFIIDDEELGETGFEQRGVGFVAHFNIGEDVTEDMTGGTAVSVEAENLIKGRITDVAGADKPLSVMGLPVVITADTVLVNVHDNGTGLGAGHVVEVSGYLGSDNVVDATRLEYRPSGLSEWELNGYVSNHVANTSFAIGSQTILLNGVVPQDCGDGLADGLLVEVKAAPDANLTTLDTVTGIRCKQPGLRVPDNVSGSEIEAEIEGVVSALNPPDIIVVQGQNVRYTAGTVFEGGVLADIMAGSRIEVDGKLHIASGILIAERVRMRRTLLHIEAPVNNADIRPGRSLEILGATIQATAWTRDEDGIFSEGLPAATRQVEVRAIVDGGGAIFATEVKDIGNPRYDDIRIRGPVTDFANPPLFEIAGMVIDASTAEELEEGSEFFNLIEPGTSVKIEEGVYDPGTGVVNEAKISIEGSGDGDGHHD